MPLSIIKDERTQCEVDISLNKRRGNTFLKVTYRKQNRLFCQGYFDVMIMNFSWIGPEKEIL